MPIYRSLFISLSLSLFLHANSWRIGYNCHIKIEMKFRFDLWKCPRNRCRNRPHSLQKLSPSPASSPSIRHSHSVAPKRSWVENRDFLEMFLPLCRKRTRRVDVASAAAAAAALGQDSFLLRKLLTAAAVESLLGTPPPPTTLLPTRST